MRERAIDDCTPHDRKRIDSLLDGSGTDGNEASALVRTQCAGHLRRDPRGSSFDDDRADREQRCLTRHSVEAERD